MKKFLILILLLLINKTFSQKENELARKMRMENKIEEVEFYDINIKNSDTVLIEHDYYNNYGNIIKNTFINNDSTIRTKYIFDYNEKKLLTKITGYNEKNEVYTIAKYKYNEFGSKTENKQFKPDSTLTNFQKREYNDRNQNTKLFNQKKNSNDFYLSQKYFYTTDEQYSKIETYNQNEKIVSISEYEYDNDKNLIVIYENIDGVKKIVTKNKYNSKNLIIEKYFPKKIEGIREIESQFGSTDKLIKFNYDLYGNKTEEITFENGVIVKKIIFKYKFFK